MAFKVWDLVDFKQYLKIGRKQSKMKAEASGDWKLEIKAYGISLCIYSKVSVILPTAYLEAKLKYTAMP
jgi:hypothetical protein